MPEQVMADSVAVVDVANKRQLAQAHSLEMVELAVVVVGRWVRINKAQAARLA